MRAMLALEASSGTRRELVSSNWIDIFSRRLNPLRHNLILASLIMICSGDFGTCILKDPSNVPVFLMMTVSETKFEGHLPEIGNSAFDNGLAAFTNENGGTSWTPGCSDLQDGKWSWEYQPYVNADLGCFAL